MAIAAPEPSQAHWLGVDTKGRDLLARIAWGARYVLAIAPIGLFVGYVLGIVLGSLAAYFGGVIDVIISRLSETILAFPTILLYILLIATIGPSVTNILIAIIVSTVPPASRIVRGLVLEVVAKPYVSAAKLRGESVAYIIAVEILPNIARTILTDACLRFGWIILSIGSLGFLGLGLPPPTPDWGGMIREGITVIMVWPHMAVVPCLALASLVVSVNLIADGLTRSR